MGSVQGDAEGIRMPPAIWGPIFWHTIHIVTLAYPVEPTEEDKAGARKFFESLTTVLPCPVCREHYKQHLIESPVEEALQSKGQLVYWAWDLHNRVNKMLNKPTITIEEFLAHMRSLGEGEKQNPSVVIPCMAAAFAGILVGAGVFWAWRHYKTT